MVLTEHCGLRADNRKEMPLLASEYWTMRELAKLFGSTSHKIGRVLKQLGLRLENGAPSSQALHQGLVKRRPVYGREFHDVWTWHVGRTLPYLEAAGLRLLPRYEACR